jgi:hypothetical protein
MGIRPSTSLRYAQGERKFLRLFSSPFVLSVARRAESKHERCTPSTSQIGKLYTWRLLRTRATSASTIVCQEERL